MMGACRAAALVAALVLAASDEASLAADTISAARTLRPGMEVSAEDLRVPAGFEAEAALLVGLEVRRAIYVNQPIGRDAVGPPTLVRRNSDVTMIFAQGGLAIRTEGRALGSGGLGERIKVLNGTSRQAGRAVIRWPGLVEVGR